MKPAAHAAPDGTYWMETDTEKVKIRLSNDKVVGEWTFPKTGEEAGSIPTSNASSTPTPSNLDPSGILHVSISNKRFQDSDWGRGIYEDALWWDLKIEAKGLSKPARAIKGTLIFSDLFGDEKLRVNWTLEKGISPGKTKTEKGVGIKYNQFKASHKWLRATDLEDLKTSFRVEQILYTDGTSRKL